MPDYLAQLRSRLLDLGCPITRIHRLTGEVSDHRDDLIQAGLEAGLTMMDAQTQAEQRLGNPADLAASLALVHRRSTWCGRHFLATFGFLPLVAFPLLWSLFLIVELWLIAGIGFGWDNHKLHVLGDNPATFRHWANVAYGADYVAIGIVALLFCWLARRSGVSWIWMLTACLICSLFAGASQFILSHHHLSLCFTLKLHWSRAVLPLLVFGSFFLQSWRAARDLRRPATV